MPAIVIAAATQSLLMSSSQSRPAGWLVQPCLAAWLTWPQLPVRSSVVMIPPSFSTTEVIVKLCFFFRYLSGLSPCTLPRVSPPSRSAVRSRVRQVGGFVVECSPVITRRLSRLYSGHQRLPQDELHLLLHPDPGLRGLVRGNVMQHAVIKWSELMLLLSG